MALQFDITKSSIYQEGKEDGIAQGITQGIAQGIAQGITQGKEEGIRQGEDRKLLEIVREMHTEGLTLTKIAGICHLTEEKVKEILNI